MIILNTDITIKLKYYSSDGLIKYFKELNGSSSNAAYKIFKNNLFFGVGLKNFRGE